jgi:D-glutamate N-acetyltransferase
VSSKRYLILAEGRSRDPHYGKTARGVLNYGAEPVVAILDSTHAGETYKGIPVVASVNDALCFNPTTALVGVATQGGRFPPEWRDLLKSSIAKGLDVENGLHEFIADDPELAELARRHNVELRDLRRPPDGLNVPTGANLQVPSTIVLTVVSDFLAGAAEQLVVEGYERGGTDLLLVEGQGSVIHPAYSGVTLGLIHGSAPHLYVLCHLAGSTEVEGYPGHPLPSLQELVALHEALSLPARPARVACIALNTRDLSEPEAQAAIQAAEAETGLPADDPVRFGAERLLDSLVPKD